VAAASAAEIESTVAGIGPTASVSFRAVPSGKHVAVTFEPDDVLLVIDVINDFEHEDGGALYESFEERADAMHDAIESARALGIPVVYVNDDHDRWDSDAPALVRAVLETERGGRILPPLAPRPGDRVLLKHRYSGFDHTALDLLLEQHDVGRLVLIGAALEGCIVQTAIDARERGFAVSILRAACATTDPELEAVAADYALRVVGARLV
jgi:nicotinamidase/pyrazinamidase